jgi:hypothetical protein
LKAKLREEIDELFEALDASSATRKDHPQVAEELADVWEVLEAFGAYLGNSVYLDARVRMLAKRDEKGRFTNIVMKLDAPIPMILHCPKCGGQHIDRGIWATVRVHRTHLCEHCGELFRPHGFRSHDKATVGVEDVAVYKLAGSGGMIGGGAK